ncbi:MAG: protein kinase [Planctomycetes bacterium]|nr:protein kinase [Planctomycetota bacterium]
MEVPPESASAGDPSAPSTAGDEEITEARRLSSEIAGILLKLRETSRGGSDDRRIEACERALSFLASRLAESDDRLDRQAWLAKNSGALRLLEDLRQPSQSQDEPPEPPGGSSAKTPERLGDYELLEKIGSGGMGDVYRARQVSLGREVALKVLRPDLAKNERVLERFAREAKAAAAIHHPSIVQVHEAAIEDERPYIVMELVRGSSLEEVLHAGGSLPTERALAIARDVAEAVAAAHEAGVLHRDIKPGNILIEGSMDSARVSGRARLADFGLAQLAAEGTLTRSGDVLGTLAYMAPEQLQGRATSRTVDVYGLGATLYALLTGRPPHVASNPATMAERVARRDPIPLRDLNPSVDRDAATICAKAMRWDPRARYENASELARDIDRRLRHEPIEARPASWTYRARLALRRNPRAAVFAGAAFVAASFAFILLLGWLRHAGLNSVATRLAEGRIDEAEGGLASLVPFPPIERTREAGLRIEVHRRRGELGLAAREAAKLEGEEGDRALRRIEQTIEAQLAGWRGLHEGGLRWTLLVAARNALDGIHGFLGLSVPEGSVRKAIVSKAVGRLEDAAHFARHLLWSLSQEDAALAVQDILDGDEGERDPGKMRDALESVLADRSKGEKAARPIAWRNPSGSLVRTVLDTGAGEGLDGILDASSRAILSLADVYLPSLPAEDRLSLMGRLENLVALRSPGAPIRLDGVSDVLSVARGDLDGNHHDDVLLVTRDSIVFLEVGPAGIERRPGRDLSPRKQKYEGSGIRAAALLDLDGDQPDELLLGGLLGPEQAPSVTRIYRWNPEAKAWHLLREIEHEDARHLPTDRAFARGDIDGDGKVDLVIGFTSGGEDERYVCLARQVLDPTGPVARLPGGGTEADVFSVFVGDLDSDGQLDIGAATGPWRGWDLRFWTLEGGSILGPHRLGPLGTFHQAAVVQLDDGAPPAVLAAKSAYSSRNAIFPPDEPAGIPNGLYLLRFNAPEKAAERTPLSAIGERIVSGRSLKAQAREIFAWSDPFPEVLGEQEVLSALKISVLNNDAGLLEAAALTWWLGQGALREAWVDLYRVDRSSGKAVLEGNRVYVGRPGAEVIAELVRLPGDGAVKGAGLLLLSQDPPKPVGGVVGTRSVRRLLLDPPDAGAQEDLGVLLGLAEAYGRRWRHDRAQDLAMKVLKANPPPELAERARETLLDALTGLSDWPAARVALDAGELPRQAAKVIEDAERLAAAKSVDIADAEVRLVPFGAGAAGPLAPPVAVVDLGELASLECIRLSFEIEIEEVSWDRGIWVELRPFHEGKATSLEEHYGVELSLAGGTGSLRRRMVLRWGGLDDSSAQEPPRVLDAASFREATGKPGTPRYHVTLEGPIRDVIRARLEELEPRAQSAAGKDVMPDVQFSGLTGKDSSGNPEPLLPPPPGRYQLGVFDRYAGVIPQEKGPRGPTRARIRNLKLQRIP